MNVQNKPEAKEPALSRYTYLNPDYMPNHVNEEYCREHRASRIAADLSAIIATAHAAAESYGMSKSMGDRGIGTMLEIAANMLHDLIGLIEMLEPPLGGSKEADEGERTGSSRIQELFQEHQRLGNEANEYHVPEGADAGKVLEALFWGRRDKTEEEMMSLPAKSAADFAAKLIVDSVYGSQFSDWNEGKLWQEARELVGGGDTLGHEVTGVSSSLD